MAKLGLRCCKQGLLFVAVRSVQWEHCGGLSRYGARALGARASVVVAYGL